MDITESLVDRMVKAQHEVIRASSTTYLTILKKALERYRKGGLFRRFFVWLAEGTGAVNWDDIHSEYFAAIESDTKLTEKLRDATAMSLQENTERLAAKVMADPQFLELLRRHMA